MGLPLTAHTLEQYYQFERRSDGKHEYLEGAILAMTGGSPRHALLIGQVLYQLARGFERTRCMVYSSDLRVRVGRAVFYPDASVVCGEFEADPLDPDTLVNPSLVVEVLSPSTEAFNRRTKLPAYQELLSVQTVIYVASERQEVTLWYREGEDEWRESNATEGRLWVRPFDGFELDVDELYAKWRP